MKKDCTFCNMNEVEDEFHFIFRFPLYNEERQILISQRYNNPNEEINLLIHLMENKGRQLISKGKISCINPDLNKYICDKCSVKSSIH